MAELDKKISQLEEKASLTGEEYVALADNTRNYKAKVKNIGSVIPSGGTADRPENPVVGTQYFDTDLGKVVTWDGSEWGESGGGTGAVVLHVDESTETQEDGMTTYRFTETQEEINAIIDKLGGAEAVTVIVSMMREGELQMIYSIPCVRMEQDGMTYYLGINVGLDTQAQMDDVASGMKVAQITLSSSLSFFAFMETYSVSIRDYLAINIRDYTKFLPYTLKSGAYLNTDGEYVENADYKVVDLLTITGGINYPDGMCFLIKDNPEASDMSVFADSSNKPVLFGTTSAANNQVCFSPFTRKASVHKDAKVYGFHSGVFDYFVTMNSKFNDMWNSLGIYMDSAEKYSISTYSEGAIGSKYNNVNGEQVDKEKEDYVSYFIYPMSLKSGDILLFDSRPGSTTDMAALKDADGNIIPAVPLNADGTAQKLAYIAAKDIDVEISGSDRVGYYKVNSMVFGYVMQLIGKTRDMMGVNGTMQQLYPETAQEGKFYNLSGEVADNEGYDISAPVSLNEGDTLLVKSLSFANVAMIKDADGNIVPARSTTQSSPIFYSYTATKATTVEISYRNDGSALFYKFNSSVFEQLAKLITANKGGDSGNLLLELPYFTGNFSTPTLGSGITDMPTLVSKIKSAKSVTLRNPSGSSFACSYFNVYSDDTAVRLITVADTLNQENVLRTNVQISYTDSSGNFFVNIVPETVTNTLVLKFPTFNGVWNVATLADGIDDMAALLDRLASHPVVLLQSSDNEFRQCVRYVLEAAEQRAYFYTVGNKINGMGGNIYSVFNVTYDTGTAQFHAEYTNYPDENGGNVEIVTELPETPDENTVYIIKGS